MKTKEEKTFMKVIKYMKWMKSKGYAVVVFTPEELGEVNPDNIEDILIEAGNNALQNGLLE